MGGEKKIEHPLLIRVDRAPAQEVVRQIAAFVFTVGVSAYLESELLNMRSIFSLVLSTAD